MIAFPEALGDGVERRVQGSEMEDRAFREQESEGQASHGQESEDRGSREQESEGQATQGQGSGHGNRASMEADATEALGDEIARLSAHIHAATYRLLVLIRKFDEQEGWGWGFRSCAEWLSWRTGISPGPAREKVRVARALGDLPLISEAMARGELSFSKVRALTRVAKPETEGELLELARHATAAHLERMVRGWRLVDRLEEAERAGAAEAQRHASRFLRLHPDHDGSWEIRGRLDPEVGALLEKALEWAREALYRREPAVGMDRVPAEADRIPAEPGRSLAEEEAVELEASPEQRLADALGLVAERAFSGGGGVSSTGREDGDAGDRDQKEPVSRAERFQVVVHVGVGEGAVGERKAAGAPDVSAETSQRQVTAAPGPTLFSPETAKRMACDADGVEMRHGSKGQVLGVGRKRRTVPPAIRRALDHRDGGCRFPGCGCRYTDAHHIVHWADGGETKLDNLVLLCRRHHRAVHEEGFRVEAREGPKGLQIRFHRPDGRLFPAVPQVPVVPADALADMVRGNRVRGVDPDAWTATPCWHGETLDLGLAIDMLRGLEGASGRGEGTSSRGEGQMGRKREGTKAKGMRVSASAPDPHPC